ncbi:MAG: DUF4380 domain-containing protein [Bacteroidales bacterium]|nr:DUF4380 domain-containing protein [Bacteroidales bacterium]
MYRMLILFIMAIAYGLNALSQGGDVKLDTITNYNSWGWQSLVIENDYIKLVIVPEIGGRVLYYGFPDDEYMWVNPDQLKQTYDPDINQSGPWGTSSGYGGYKVWPAPQDQWGWPPPPFLAWGSFTFTTETATGDSVVVYVRSQVEKYKTPGLQLVRRYKVYRNSTMVKVEQILINTNTTSQSWSIWDVTQATVKHDGSEDYSNFSTYFPVSINDVNGKNNGTYSKVSETVTKYNFVNGKSGKMFSFLLQGWIAFVDERDEQSYTKVFEIFPENDNHPDNNSNFEIYSSGGQYIELEVLSPVEEIGAGGDSIRYDEYWYAAKVNGDVMGASHAGIIRTPLSYTEITSTLAGEYGIFSNGFLALKFYDKAGQALDSSDAIMVSASEKYTLSLITEILPDGTDKIKLFAYDADANSIGVLDSFSLDGPSALKSGNMETQCRIFPTFIEAGNSFFVDVLNEPDGNIAVEIHSLADGKLAGKYLFANNAARHRVMTNNLGAGMYVVIVRQAMKVLIEKIVIR